MKLVLIGALLAALVYVSIRLFRGPKPGSTIEKDLAKLEGDHASAREKIKKDAAEARARVRGATATGGGGTARDILLRKVRDGKYQ